MGRGWQMSSSKDGNIIAIGYDDGTLALKIGGDEPLASMKNGKIIWANNMEIQLINLKSLKVSDKSIVKDGEPIHVIAKDIGTSDIYP
jgi:coatomer subunit beta'